MQSNYLQSKTQQYMEQLDYNLQRTKKQEETDLQTHCILPPHYETNCQVLCKQYAADEMYCTVSA
jgi:hypothetical protein